MTIIPFALAAASLVPGEPASSLDANDSSETIIVAASRASEGLPANENGGSATLLTPDQIENRQTRDVADVLRDVPGVAVGSVPGQTQIRLRGTEANHVLVLIDGIEVSDPFTGEFDFSTLIADEAARIEVLRGQQSALYGSDAIGGVVNYITASGRDRPGASARIEGGSFSTLNGAARLAGADGALDYALTGSLVSTGGTPNARNGSRDLGRDSEAASFKANWSAASNFLVTAVGRIGRTKGDFNDSDSDPLSPTFGLIVDTPGTNFVNRSAFGLLKGELNLAGNRWKNALSLQFAGTDRDGFRSDERSFGDDGQRLKASYVSTVTLGDGRLVHRITVALDAERERFRNDDPTGTAFTGWRHASNLGLVGQYELKLGNRAVLGAALRKDVNDRYRDTLTYRVQGNYRLGAYTRVRAASGSGVKNPNFFELFGFIDGEFIGNPDLRPERSVGWEAGIDQEIPAARLNLSATYFQSRLKGEIFTVFPPPDFIATTLNRDSRSTQHGIELEATGKLGHGLALNGSYTFLKAREEGLAEVRRPTHVASLAIDWRPRDGSSGLTFVARYTGASDDLAFTDPSFIPLRVRLKPYLLLNLDGDIAISRHLSLFGRVENLAGQHYEQVFSFTNPGRSAIAGLRARI